MSKNWGDILPATIKTEILRSIIHALFPERWGDAPPPLSEEDRNMWLSLLDKAVGDCSIGFDEIKPGDLKLQSAWFKAKGFK